MSPQSDGNDLRKITVTYGLGTVKRIANGTAIFLLPLATHRVTIQSQDTSFLVEKGSALYEAFPPCPSPVGKRDNIADGAT